MFQRGKRRRQSGVGERQGKCFAMEAMERREEGVQGDGSHGDFSRMKGEQILRKEGKDMELAKFAGNGEERAGKVKKGRIKVGKKKW